MTLSRDSTRGASMTSLPSNYVDLPSYHVHFSTFESLYNQHRTYFRNTNQFISQLREKIIPVAMVGKKWNK